MTDEIVLNADQTAERDGLAGVQLETSPAAQRGGRQGPRTRVGGHPVDAELSVAEGMALRAAAGRSRTTRPVPEHLRGVDLEGLVADLPELLKRHLERFLALGLRGGHRRRRPRCSASGSASGSGATSRRCWPGSAAR